MLSSSAIIEVAIGVIFVYTVLSILVTQVNNVIVYVLNLRARNLADGINNLLIDPVVRARVLSHPLINLVGRPETGHRALSADEAERVAAGKTTRVSWIEPGKFVMVLKDVVALTTREEVYLDLYKAIELMPVGTEKSQIREMVRNLQNTGAGLPELHQAIHQLSDPVVRRDLLNGLDKVEAEARQFQVENAELARLVQGVRNVESPVLQDTLDALLGTTRSLKEAEQRIETWFNNAMDQLSARYTTLMQTFSILVGLLLTLLLNVDTINLAETLWNDPVLRGAVAATAEDSVQSGQVVLPGAAAAGDAESGQAGASFEGAQMTLDTLLGLRLPIGWEYRSFDQDVIDTEALLTDPRDNARNLFNLLPWQNSKWFGLWLQKIAGWAVTTIAIAQGAPFWFNLLNRLTGGGRGRSSSAGDGAG